jgi:predicted dehydrogenase
MSIGRRDFIAGAAAVGGVQLLGTARASAAASDSIRVAILGLGGRGRDHMRDCAKIPGVKVVAFCDPDETRMAQRAAEFQSLTGQKPALHQDLRRVLEDKDIDAVSIATGNHWHALAAIWACQAGKHVYVEKPVCHDFFSGAQMVAASHKYGRLVQGGTQRRSSGYVRRAIQALREGIIGDVYMARCVHYQDRASLGFKEPENPPGTLDWDLWLGPAPLQSFNRNLHPYNWHWFWDFGNGELGNNGIHYIDVARWGLNKGLPSKIYSTGGRFGYRDQGQTPNTQLVTYQFDDGIEMVMEIRGRYTNSEGGVTSGPMFYGSKGYMISDPHTEGFKVFLNGRSTPEPELGRLDDVDRSGDEELSHFQNFFDAVRAGKREMLTAEINETYLSTAFCLLGNISYRLKRELHFDPSANRFVGDREADEMLRDNYRAPYVVPDSV